MDDFLTIVEEADCDQIDLFFGVSDNRPCCKETFNATFIPKCVAQRTSELHATHEYMLNMAGAQMLKPSGPLFVTRSSDNSSGETKPEHSKFGVIVLTFQSTSNFSLSYTKMDAFYTQVTEWISNKFIDAPAAISNGGIENYIDVHYHTRRLVHSYDYFRVDDQ